ncbi:unnamed protein product, partial [Ectocarpus sp. 8 AP-2014]
YGFVGSICPGFFRLTTAAKSAAGGSKQRFHIPNFVNFTRQSSDKLLRASLVLEILAVQSQPITPFLPTSERDTTPYADAKDTSSTMTTSLKGYPLGTVPQRFYIIGACRRRPFLDRSCFL